MCRQSDGGRIVSSFIDTEKGIVMRKYLVAAAAGLLMSQTALAATDQKSAINDLVNSQIRGWVADAVVVRAIRSQNARHAGLSQADIDKLDKQWRAETKTTRRPLIDRVLANTLSGFLKGKKDEGEGLYTEIFVVDNRGLNVGQSDVTSDYWQGDEAKWKKTFLAGPDGLLIADVEFDESTQSYQSQVSFSITDPDTDEVIGSITVGINVELLRD